MDLIARGMPARLRAARSIRFLGRIALASLLAMFVFACRYGENTFSSQITGYNHTDKTIGSVSANGSWGGNGEIKVFAINAGLGHPDYSLRGDEADLTPGVPNFQFPGERPALGYFHG